MAHSLESTIRDAYAAFECGDVDGYLESCSEDFSFNIPGRGAIAGSWHGKEGLHELARKAMEVTGGRFREVVEDVLSERSARRCSRTTSIHVGWPIKRLQNRPRLQCSGRQTRSWEQPQDLSIFDEAWTWFTLECSKAVSMI